MALTTFGGLLLASVIRAADASDEQKSIKLDGDCYVYRPEIYWGKTFGDTSSPLPFRILLSKDGNLYRSNCDISEFVIDNPRNVGVARSGDEVYSYRTLQSADKKYTTAFARMTVGLPIESSDFSEILFFGFNQYQYTKWEDKFRRLSIFEF